MSRNTTTNPPPPAPVTPADRLALTLCLAIILHAVVLLGVTFSPEEKQSPQFESLEIILVHKESEPPEDAKVLAQANLEGGGESDETERPTTPMPAPFPDPEPKVVEPPPLVETPPPQAAETIEQPEQRPADPEPEPEPAPQQLAVETPEPEPEPEPEPVPEPEETAEQAESPSPDTKTAGEITEEESIEPEKIQPQAPTGAELMSRSMETASLNAEIERKLKARAERPRRTFISASTQEYKYASYMEAWRAKVERIGNLNYPEEARRRGLTGSLILDVALKPDGSVDDITVRRSSGNKLLDDAAIRIVKLAAPYAPFPDNIRRDTDILHITRTWQFTQGERFR